MNKLIIFFLTTAILSAPINVMAERKPNPSIHPHIQHRKLKINKKLLMLSPLPIAGAFLGVAHVLKKTIATKNYQHPVNY